MEKVFIISLVITFFFGLTKFLEMKFVNDKIKPLKIFVREIAIVFISSVVGAFIYFHFDGSIGELFNVITNTTNINVLSSPQIFTDEPGF
jgi:hypothetical protein